MPPLRVLHVTPYYEDAWAYGGIPRVASRLADGLARRGHRVTVCTTDACDAVSRLPAGATRGDDGGGVEVRVFPNLSNHLAYRLQLFTPRGLADYLRRICPQLDVAHLHGCHHLPGVIAARALTRAGVPYFLTPNGTAPLLERRLAAKWLFDRLLGRAVVPGAVRVLAVSEAERRQLASMGVAAAALRLLPNPVDLAELEPPPERGRLRARLGLGDAPLVLFLGMLTPRKGVDVLIDAFAAARLPAARLVLAGNDRGIQSGLRRRLRRAGVAEVATFTGLLRGRERLEALADADVVVYPSHHEAFGLVPLEAILCGSPVIVADDHGCGELIAEVGGGERVPPGDVDSLAAALRRMLADPGLWRQRAAEAAARVRDRFATDVVCSRLERLYAEVVGDAGSRAA